MPIDFRARDRIFRAAKWLGDSQPLVAYLPRVFDINERTIDR
jgi:hypothetical protein